MIEYVVGHNPDDRVIKKASKILKNGGLISLPLDTNWVVLCDPFNPEAVAKLYKIRKIDHHKHFSLICLNFQKASSLALIEDSSYALVKKVIPGPYTFIFNAQKKIQKSLKASKIDHEVGLRFPKNALGQSLLIEFDECLLSTHLTLDMFEVSYGIEEVYSALIEEEFSHLIDLIIDPGIIEFQGLSTIIDFTQNAPELIRQGVGSSDIFFRKD